MTPTTVTLPDPLKAYVDDRVAAGGYNSPGEYIRDLIRRDQQREQLRGPDPRRPRLRPGRGGRRRLVRQPARRGPRPGRRVSKGLRLRPAARADIRAVVAHYRADSGPGIALGFTDQLQRVLVHVGRGLDPGSPRLGPGARPARPARSGRSRASRTSCSPSSGPDHFDVLRVLHGLRDLPPAFRPAA